MSVFRLEKWYQDVVSVDGRARIAYAARVDIGALTLHYASVLAIDGEHVRSAATLRGVTLPDADAPWRWRCESLGLDVSIALSAPPCAARILDTPRGSIEWNCFAPRAHVVFRYGDDAIEGTGYAERLVMTLPPWALPWDRLRWGRAHAGEFTCVWIELDGASGRRAWSFVNDRGPAISSGDRDRLLTSDGDELLLDEHRTLRQGRLGETVLGIWSDAARLLPARILGLSENKWLSRARMRGAHGFAIHEEVTWPKAPLLTRV